MTRCSLPHVVGMAPCFCHVSNAWAVLPRQTCLSRARAAAGFWSAAQVSLEGCLADPYLTADSPRANAPEAHAQRGLRTNLDGARSLIQSGLKIYYPCVLGYEAWPLLSAACPLIFYLLSWQPLADARPPLTSLAQGTPTSRRHITHLDTHASSSMPCSHKLFMPRFGLARPAYGPRLLSRLRPYRFAPNKSPHNGLEGPFDPACRGHTRYLGTPVFTQKCICIRWLLLRDVIDYLTVPNAPSPPAARGNYGPIRQSVVTPDYRQRACPLSSTGVHTVFGPL